MTRATQWETTPRSLGIVLLAIAVLVGAVVYLGFHYGIPFVASWIAGRVPASVAAQMSEEALEALERDGTLEPSALAAEQQDRLSAAFARLMGPDRAATYRLVYRNSPRLGANAAALPSGIIVVTDRLVELAHDDREVLGVLAHEAGHVDERHGLRLLAQSAALTMAVAWLVGDVGTLAALVPTTVLHAKYSRAFEREADAYAARLMRRNGLAPSALADLLERLEDDQRERSGGTPDGPLVGYASSHPPTPERLEYLRSQ